MLRRPLLLALAAAALATATACGRVGATIDGDGPGSGGGGAPTAGAGAETEAGAGEATITAVVDGDTVRVRVAGRRDTESVRLIGIDTPETHGPGGLRECFGEEASRRTAALVPEGTPVRLERDVEARDRYGRLLAYVYRRRDGLFVNLSLAQDGYATSLTIAPNVAHRDVIADAVADARAAGIGLWGRCGGPDEPL